MNKDEKALADKKRKYQIVNYITYCIATFFLRGSVDSRELMSAMFKEFKVGQNELMYVLSGQREVLYTDYHGHPTERAYWFQRLKAIPLSGKLYELEYITTFADNRIAFIQDQSIQTLNVLYEMFYEKFGDSFNFPEVE